MGQTNDMLVWWVILVYTPYTLLTEQNPTFVGDCAIKQKQKHMLHLCADRSVLSVGLIRTVEGGAYVDKLDRQANWHSTEPIDHPKH